MYVILLDCTKQTLHKILHTRSVARVMHFVCFAIQGEEYVVAHVLNHRHKSLTKHQITLSSEKTLLYTVQNLAVQIQCFRCVSGWNLNIFLVGKALYRMLLRRFVCKRFHPAENSYKSQVSVACSAAIEKFARRNNRSLQHLVDVCVRVFASELCAFDRIWMRDISVQARPLLLLLLLFVHAKYIVKILYDVHSMRFTSFIWLDYPHFESSHWQCHVFVAWMVCKCLLYDCVWLDGMRCIL